MDVNSSGQNKEMKRSNGWVGVTVGKRKRMLLIQRAQAVDRERMAYLKIREARISAQPESTVGVLPSWFLKGW